MYIINTTENQSRLSSIVALLFYIIDLFEFVFNFFTLNDLDFYFDRQLLDKNIFQQIYSMFQSYSLQYFSSLRYFQRMKSFFNSSTYNFYIAFTSYFLASRLQYSYNIFLPLSSHNFSFYLKTCSIILTYPLTSLREHE